MLKSAAVLLTNRCNGTCSFCGAVSLSSAAEASVNEPDRKKLRILFQQLAALGTRSVLLSGGEPLLRKDLFHVICDLGLLDLRCALFSNGTLLTAAHIRKLQSLDNISFVRLSVEYPESVLRKTGKYNRFHPTATVLDKVSSLADAGLYTGVNVTLFPDNLGYAEELASIIRRAGAQFVRFVPWLPVPGKAGAFAVPDDFSGKCVRTVHRLNNRYLPEGQRPQTDSAERLKPEDAAFCSSCKGGTSAVTIEADGRARICPMADLQEKNVNVYTTGVEHCLETLSRRRRYLQEKLIRNPDGICGKCPVNDRCRGGCLAEWAVRGYPAGQPVCYRKFSADVMGAAKKSTKTTSRMNDYSSSTRTGPVACIRSHPFWTIRF